MIAAPWLRMGSSTERAARAASLYRHDERVPRKSTCVAKLFFEEGDVRRLPSSPRVASRRGEARRGEARRGEAGRILPPLAAPRRAAKFVDRPRLLHRVAQASGGEPKEGGHPSAGYQQFLSTNVWISCARTRQAFETTALSAPRQGTGSAPGAPRQRFSRFAFSSFALSRSAS
ncbi:hypothetical protein A8H36_05650 [Burkholderia thailandensis]|nr:hypothetical protein A8H36_05650 [Burkholderia thailandensis]